MVFFGLMAFLFTFILSSRRFRILQAPQVWQEDGVYIIPSIVRGGLIALLEPIHGYYITSSKIITYLSLQISFLYYPEVSTVLTWLMTVLVGLAVVYSPTHLKHRALCALSIFLLPSDPEVFGTPLYTFWWTSILLFLVVLWDEKSCGIGLRAFYLLLGGLSSVVGIVVLPLLLWRGYRFRKNKNEIIIAALGTLTATVQLTAFLKTNKGAFPPLENILIYSIPKFFGSFLIGISNSRIIPLVIAALAILFLIGIYTWKAQAPTWVRLFLTTLLAGSVLMSALRVDPIIIHPAHAGPRYFFFPYILIYWVIFQVLFYFRNSFFRFISILCIALALKEASQAWSRDHYDLNWRQQVLTCSKSDRFDFSFHLDGLSKDIWQTTLDGDECRRMLRQ